MIKTRTRLFLVSLLCLSALSSLRAHTFDFKSFIGDTFPTIQVIKEPGTQVGTVKLRVTGGQKFRWNTGATTHEMQVMASQVPAIKVEVDTDDGWHWHLEASSALSSNYTTALRDNQMNTNALRSAAGSCGTSFAYQNETCVGGTVQLRVTGGTSEHRYLWSTGATTSIIVVTPSNGDFYWVNVSNSTNTCQQTHTSNPIIVRSPSINNITATNQLDCTAGNMTLQIVVSNPAPAANLEYSLDGETWQTSSQFANKGSGAYTAYIRQAGSSNCEVSYQQTIEEFEPIEFAEFQLNNLGDCTLGNVSTSIEITGGKIEGYRYRLNGGLWSSSPNYNGLSSGSYYLQAEPLYVSSGNCGRYLQFGVEETNGVSLSGLTVAQDQDCTLGNVILSAQANQPGAAGIEYRLNGGAWQSSNQFSGLATGAYTVELRSTAGCPVANTSKSISVAEKLYPKLANVVVANDQDCTNGNVHLSAVLQDATIPARFRLNGGAWSNNPIFSNLASGTYVLEVAAPDASTCTSSLSKTVQELGQVSITTTPTYNILDCATGNIAIEVKHNALTTEGLQFRLSGGAWQSSTWFTGLGNGTYTIEGQVLGQSCSFNIPSKTLKLTELSGTAVVSNVSMSNATDCTAGNARIQVNLAQSSSTAQYRLLGISSWQSSNVFTNRSSGTYVVEMRPSSTATCVERDTVLIDEKTVTIGTLALSGHDDCIPGNLRLEVAVTGTPQSGPWQYRLASSWYLAPTAWQSSNVFTNPGGYNKVEVKTSSGCVFSKNGEYVFEEIEPIAISITGLSYLQGATDCTKGNTRISINTAVTVEGTGARVNQWRVNGGAWQWSPVFQSLGRDSIYVEVNVADDNRSCIIGKKLLVDEKTPIEIASLTPSQHEDCTLNNAKITALAPNGQGTKLYKLNSGSFGGSPTFSNLSSGLHLITVKDAANCQDTMSIRIAEPALLSIASTSKTNESDCPAGNAQITVNTTGARGSLTLKVNNGSPLFSNVISNLSTGTYAISAQDAAGCTASTSVSITELAQLSLGLSKEREHDCIPGNTKINVSTSGARGALRYRLDNGTPQLSNAFVNIPNGLHTVVVVDAAGCTASDTIRIAEDARLVVNAPLVQDVKCAGGSDGAVTFPIQGGAMPYVFSWSNLLPSTTNSVQNVQAGNYALTVIDAKGCSAVKTVTVSEPGGIGYGHTKIYKEVSCYGGSDGSIEVTPFTGGVPPYRYTWSNGDTTPIATNLSSGQYSLTVTDAVGCEVTLFSTGLTEPARININATQLYTNHLDCTANNVSITTTATGGRGAYQYSLDAGPAQSSGIFPGKTTGTYQLLVRDSTDCFQEFTIEVTEEIPLSLSYDLLQDEDCIPNNVQVIPNPSNARGAVSYLMLPQNTFDFNTDLQNWGDGNYILSGIDTKGCIATVAVAIDEKQPAPAIDLPDVEVCAGATASLSINNAADYTAFLWSNGATTPSISLSPGATSTYTVTATASNGCEATKQVVLRVNPLPLVDVGSDQSVCAGATVNLSAVASGGTAPYSYAWSNGASGMSTSVAPDSNRIYFLTLTDGKGCTDKDTIAVNLIPFPETQITGSDIICFGDSTTLNAPLGDTYHWSTGASTRTITVSPDSTTTYEVTVTNGPGCSSVAEKMVRVPLALTLSHQLENDQDCIAQNAVVVPSAVGGWGDKTFRIARYGELYFSENLGGLASGSYTLMAEDSVGCTISQEVEIKETPVGIDSLTLQGVDDCVPGNTKLIVETTGDHLPLVYRLNGRLLSGPVVDLPRVAGNYTLEVEDTMGCADHQVQYFPAYDSLVVASSNVTDCTLIDGTIQFSYEGVDISKLSFSIDGGENWQDQNGTFMALSKGSYIPMVRNNASSCVQTADTININAPDCFPIVGFLKDTLTINDARELVVLPWQIDRNGYSDTLNYTLRLGREGDGVPHFNDERLRSTTSPIHFREYPAEHPGGKDSLVLTLQDSAYLYRIPEAYTFHLETPAGSPLKIDPLHGRMTVFVNFTDSVIIERKEVTLCPGTEQLTLGEDLGDGYCYAWEGPVSSHFPVISITPTQSGEYRLNIIRNTDFKLYKTIIYSVKVESKQVTITSSGNVLCEGGAKLLGLLFSDGGAIDPLSWEIKWEDGSSAVPRVVRPSSSSIYGVKIKNRLSACVIEDTLRIQVLQKPSHVTILPVEAFICSTSSSPGLDLEVEFPRTDSLTYFWSNGTRDYKTKVFQPGSYYVDVAYKNMASCATRFYTQVKNGFKVAIEADTSGICPDSIPLTARIINPVQGTTYAYSWSNGETTQTIVSQGMNYTYAVTVSNNQQGCVGSDSLDVEPILNRMEQRKAQKIQAELLALGFINFPCKILPLGLSPSPQLRSNEVVDYAGGMVIELGGQRINLAQRLAGVVSSMQVDSLAATGYITRNENFCEAAKRFKLALASYNQDLEDHDILLEVWENPDGNSADQLFILVNPDKLNTNQVYDALLADSVSLKPVILPTKQFLITVRGRDSLFFCGTWKPNLRVDSLLKVLKGETSRLLFPKCTINSKSIEVINAKYYFQNNEDPTKHYFAGPFPAYRYAWLVNNVVLFDTAARKTSISLNEISGRLINGLNSVKLRVIGKTDPKFSEDVEIQIEHTPSITPPPPPVSTPLDSFRMEVLVNNILRGRYRSESTVNDDALKIGDEVRLSLQKQNSDGIWSNQSGVDWQEINGRRVTGGSFLDTVQRTDPITKSITANLIGMQNRFLINLVREDTFPPSRVFLPIIDPRVRADSQRIVNVYNRVLSGIQSRNPDLYNFATGGDLSISIYFTDATDSRLGSTNNGVTHHSPIRNNRTYDSLKISNVIDSLHNPILPGMLPPRIVYDAVVVTNLTINTVELDQISGYYLELQKLIAETRTQTPTFAARLELTAQNDQLISIDSLNLFLSPSQIARYQDAVANISIIKPRMSQLLAAIRQNSSTAATYFETQIRNGTAIPTDSLQRVRYTISDGLVPDFVRPDKEVEIYLNWPAFKGDPIGAQSSMAKTLAHELTHARYPFAQPLTSLKWDLIRDQQSSYGYDLSDKKGKNGHCSEGSGHERFNPENRDSCKAQY